MTTADAAYWVGFTRDLFAAVAIIVAAVLAVTLYAKLRPGFRLRIIDKWVGDRLIVRFEIENRSAVYAIVEHASSVVRESTSELGKDGPCLSHFVCFKDASFIVEPSAARNPTGDKRIKRERETRIYPGEVLAVERVCDFPGEGVVVQIGLQVKLEERYRRVHPEHQQTTTRFVVKPPPEPVQPD